MIRGIAGEAFSKSIISSEDMEAGIKDLNRTAEGGGTFCYTFFKATAFKTAPHNLPSVSSNTRTQLLYRNQLMPQAFPAAFEGVANSLRTNTNTTSP